MKEKIIIGTRGSQLALWQANWVKEGLNLRYPELEVRIKIIRTSGDKIQDVALAKIGGKGLFVKEIEEALLRREIDLAVHSMKDIPTELPPSLFIAAVTKREDPRDVFIGREKRGFREFRNSAALIGTSSLRRQAQLLHLNPNFKLRELRGNLDTRLRKLDSENLDGIVVAAVGLKRMGWEDRISDYLSFEFCLPAVGQGVLGLEARREAEGVLALIKEFNHPETSLAVAAERSFLQTLQGGCQVPIAAYGELKGEDLVLEGLVASVDGKKTFREQEKGSRKNPQALGIRLAERLKEEGAEKILQEIYG